MSRQRSEFTHRTTIFEGAFRAWSLIGTLDPDDPSESNPAVSCPDPFELKAYSETEFVYEPLPRSGLQHPFVKAVLSPWLGPGVNQEAVDLGLATLRTWWQHRRKGPNKTAEKALSEIQNIKAVESYVKHFFTLAHCLVFRDQVQPPRSLQAKMKQVADTKRFGQENPMIVIKGQCIPGAVDLLGVVEKVTSFTTKHAVAFEDMGNLDKIPMVFVNSMGDKHFILDVGGITCAHCVKIVETVLRGCRGSQSPVPGLDDAAADRDGCVLVKIDNVGDAQRIAVQAIRNLSLVGYTAKPREVAISQFFGKAEAMEKVITLHASTYPAELFDWTVPCCCPDSGVYRDNCRRHSQITDSLFRAFDEFQERVLAGAHDNRPSDNATVEGDWGVEFESDFDSSMHFGRIDDFYQIEPLPLRSSEPARNLHEVKSGAMDHFPDHPSFLPDAAPTTEFHDHYEPIGFAPIDFDIRSVFEQKQSNSPTCTSCRPITEL